jgi:glycogen operon protein
VTAHDGFTLQDAVTYTTRQNELNGESGKDGSNENWTSNWGAEGESTDASINAIRERVKRSLMMTLLFSHGTPMILGGDELCRTQKGNNNAYCQDNDVSWLDWSGLLDEEPIEPAATMCRFTERVINLRKKHASLRSGDFLHGKKEVAPGLRDVDWFTQDGVELTSEDWKNVKTQTLMLRRAVVIDGFADVTLFILNSSQQDREFVYPKPYLPWEAEANAADPDGQSQPAISGSIIVCAHSAVLCAAGVRV